MSYHMKFQNDWKMLSTNLLPSRLQDDKTTVVILNQPLTVGFLEHRAKNVEYALVECHPHMGFFVDPFGTWTCGFRDKKFCLCVLAAGELHINFIPCYEKCYLFYVSRLACILWDWRKVTGYRGCSSGLLLSDCPVPPLAHFCVNLVHGGPRGKVYLSH